MSSKRVQTVSIDEFPDTDRLIITSRKEVILLDFKACD